MIRTKEVKMELVKINENYHIHEKIFETQGLIIYRAERITGEESCFVTLHAIKNRPLIKYYIQIEKQLGELLPYVESFILDGDLYMSFKTLDHGVLLTQRSVSTVEKKKSILHLLAKLSIGQEIPNFIKWQLINSESLLLDRNRILHIEAKLSLLNPDFFNDFKSIQNKIAELIAEIFEAPIEDKGVLTFLEKLKMNAYADYLPLFADAKLYFSMTYDEASEPWFYTLLYNQYLALKKNSKRLVFVLLIAVIAFNVKQYYSKAEALGVKPYVKTKIGTLTYDDPYSSTLETATTLVLDAPPKPVSTAAPKPVEVAVVKTPVPAAKSPEVDVIYSVKRNEYLIKISKDFYGDGKYAYAIAKYNQIKSPSVLRVNFPLKLPPKATIEKIYQDMQSKK